MKFKHTKWLLLAFILLLSSCTNAKNPGNDDQEKQTAVTKETVAELYSYIQFPEYYSMNTHTADPTNPFITEPFIDAIVKYFELDKYDLLTETHYQLEYLQDAPRIPYSEVHSLYEKMYGKADKLPEKLHFPAKGIDFIYEETTDSYVLSIWQGEGNENRNGEYYRTDYSYKQDGEFLYIYDKFAQYYKSQNGTGFTVYGANHYYVKDPYIVETTEDSQDKQNKNDPSSLYYKLFNGLLDEQLPTYKHTYNLSENGTYYWVSTELMQE
ncbi:MAG: hypothetical protein IJE40_02070 [Clostridia bacterium]|nr:hypothetical protein [Clostridia bacterium]